MGSASTREGAAVAFERFWPPGLPFPPEAPWLAARMSRRRTGSAYARVVTDPVLAARVAQEAGIELHGGQQVQEDESVAGAIGVGLALGTLVVLVVCRWIATDDGEDEDEDEDTDTGAGETQGDGDDGTTTEGGGGDGFWDPDGTLGGGRKPVWA